MNNKTRLLTLTSLFAAMVFIFTAYIFHIPIGTNGGYIHIGDAFIFMAGSFLPGPYAELAAAIGAGFADFMTGGALWLPATIIIKPVMCFIFRRTNNFLSPVIAGVVGIVLYYLYEALLFGNFIAPIYSIPLGMIQVFGSAAVYYVYLGFKKRKGD